MNKILAIVPARKGSKSIPNKNLVELHGRPMLHYTVALARELLAEEVVSRVVLSTDSEQIAQFWLGYGLETPLMRTAELSLDSSRSIDMVLDVLKRLEEDFDAVLLLQPTSPLRTFDQVCEAIAIFESTEADSLISCREDRESLYATYSTDKDFYGSPIVPNHGDGSPRQLRPSLFVRNGAIYIARTTLIFSSNSLICSRPKLFRMNETTSININSFFDLSIAEMIMNSASSRRVG